jgi:hypothetical protein
VSFFIGAATLGGDDDEKAMMKEKGRKLVEFGSVAKPPL